AQKTSASFRWVSPTSMEIYVRYPESAHSETFICDFTAEKVVVKTATSLHKLATPGAPYPQFTGTMVK
ncbi:MAG: hypothetical protein INR69_21325, partial [Mucilaginibacter polytrichastri]|nr:hypothetical protein [Mucilaginibacter polytrichastri]